MMTNMTFTLLTHLNAPEQQTVETSAFIEALRLLMIAANQVCLISSIWLLLTLLIPV